MKRTGEKPLGRKRRGWRYWRNLVLFGIVLAVVFGYFGLALIISGQWAHPLRNPVCCATPAVDYENVIFQTADGITLRGWYIPSKNRAAVILTHGLHNNRTAMLIYADILSQHGYGILLYDVRAHGESGGDTSRFDGEDVLAALTYLQTRPDVDRGKIGALGISLGGMLSIQAAARSTDLRAVVSDGAGGTAFKDMPPPADLHSWLYVPLDFVFFPILSLRIKTMPITDAIKAVSPRPLLIISGGGQESRMNRGFFMAAGEPKYFWEVPEAGHIEAITKRTKEYSDKIIAFFNQALLEGKTPVL